MKIVCEISGGADSMAAVLKTKEMFPRAKLYGIMFKYGQKPFKIEHKKAEEFCKKEKISLKVVEIKKLFTKGTITGEGKAETKGVANIYTPLRNLVFSACAASYAENIGASYIISGSKGLNDDGKPYSFRDSILPFYEIFNCVVNFAAYKPIKILPILTYQRNNKMSKREVYEYLNKKGYGPTSFWNCFNKGPKQCGKCNNCVEFEQLNHVFTNFYYDTYKNGRIVIEWKK